MDLAIKRFDVFLVALDPTVGSELKKTRPCLVISPDEMNRHLNTVLVAPMTTKLHGYPTRIPFTLHGVKNEIALDQIRVTDRIRFVKKIGSLPAAKQKEVISVLSEMFSE